MITKEVWRDASNSAAYAVFCSRALNSWLMRDGGRLMKVPIAAPDDPKKASILVEFTRDIQQESISQKVAALLRDFGAECSVSPGDYNSVGLIVEGEIKGKDGLFRPIAGIRVAVADYTPAWAAGTRDDQADIVGVTPLIGKETFGSAELYTQEAFMDVAEFVQADANSLRASRWRIGMSED